MGDRKPLILVSNDDGVMAEGISKLVKFLRPLGEIVVVAPDSPRSGSGSALAVTRPAHYQLVKREMGLATYKCIGTPIDCIKPALGSVLDRRPDLIVGSVNRGDNSAINVHCSGTMGMVIEGCLKGIPLIGLSPCSHRPNTDFGPSGPYVREIVTMVLEEGLPLSAYLNVNFPDTPNLKRVKICEQAKGCWMNEWVTCPHLDGRNYFWLTGSFTDRELEDENNDHWTLKNGHVTATPTIVDMTAYGFIGELDGHCQQLEF